MKFENTIVTGFENAILGARLPMCKNLDEAKEKSDSIISKCEDTGLKILSLGVNDLKLAQKLIKADASGGGQPNSKFLRMIHVQVCITAPLFWWKEADTYKVGTTANSTSTMHKLASTPITKDCFEMDDAIQEVHADLTFYGVDFYSMWKSLIDFCENLRQKYNETKDKRYWRELIRLLPESWLQTRMFDCDYATLRNIYKWRKNHKLEQWHTFCEWIESLPYARELICE